MRVARLVTLVAVLMVGAGLRADTFSFTISSAAVNGSGTFTTVSDPNALDVQDIESISGTVNGSAISALVPAGYDALSYSTLGLADGECYLFDDLYYTAGDPFDYGGVLLQTADGNYFNLYQDPSLGAAYATLNGTSAYDTLPSAIAADTVMVQDISAQDVPPRPTPEPSGMALLGTGVLVVAFTVRKKMLTGAGGI